VLSLVPLLGSFITEPAAMTLAALILRDQFFTRGLSTRLMYATLGVLFVNISIGGTLTPSPRPGADGGRQVDWNTAFMLSPSAGRPPSRWHQRPGATLLFRRELGALAPAARARAARWR
jgi:hypothetical protein